MENIHIVLGAPKKEKIKPLMKNKGLVIGVDRGAFFALEEGIQVDIALGDFDSISAEEKETIQQEVKEVWNYPPEKDDTDTEIALLHTLEHHNNANVYIYNWYGGRIDHLYSILLVVLQERFRSIVSHLHFVSKNNYVSHYLPGAYEIKKMNEMDYLSYILLTGVEDLTLKEVKYPLNEASFAQPLALVSNEFNDDRATFSFKKGIIAVVQSRDK